MFDFGQNVAGYVTLRLPAGHDLPAGARIRIGHAEILHAPASAPSEHSNTTVGEEHSPAIYDSYCKLEQAHGHPLRHEPCKPHPGMGHDTPDRYIGDWNAANMTNEYVVQAGGAAVEYSPLFAAAGFRYAALAVHGDAHLPAFEWAPTLQTLTSRFVHSDVPAVGHLRLAPVPAEGNGTEGTPDILGKIHTATRYSALSNLWSVPTGRFACNRMGTLKSA